MRYLSKLFAMAVTLSLVAFTIGTAFAADMAVKAQQPTNKWLAYPTGCGFYYGVNTQASGGGVTTTALSGSQALAGDVGVTLGYTCPVGANSFWFVEGMADISRVNGGQSAAAFSLSGSATFEQRVGFGAPWSTVASFASLFPGLSAVAVPSIPTLPNGITAGPVNPYLFVGLNERDVGAQVGLANGKAWLVSWEAGIGALTRLSNGMVLDTWAKYQAASTGMQVGLTGQNFKTGDFVGVGMALKL